MLSQDIACYAGLPVNSFYERAVCRESEIRLPAANVIAPLSVLSVAAQIILAIELVKTRNHNLRQWVGR